MTTLLVGERARAAFGIDADGSSAGLALWLGGVRLGAPDRVEDLATFRAALARFAAGAPPAPPELAGQPAAAVFAAVRALLDDPAPERADYPWDRAALYEALTLAPNGCAPFDGEHALVLQEPAGDRVVFRPFEANQVSEVRLAPGEMVRLARETLARLS